MHARGQHRSRTRADEDLFGQTDDDGTGPPGRGGVHGVDDHLGGLIGVIEGEHLLRGRGEPAVQIEFLEGFAAAMIGGDEADEDDERGRILVGGVDSDLDVRRTGTTRDHGDAGHSGHPPLGDGHICGPALLAADDRGDSRIAESVDDVEIRLAGNQISASDSVCFEFLDDEMTCRKRRGGVHTPCLSSFRLLWLSQLPTTLPIRNCEVV